FSILRKPSHRPRIDDLVSGLSHSLKLNSTSSALKSSPLDHLIPLRRLSVHWVRSSLGFQLSSRYGLVMLSLPVSVRYSYTWRNSFESNTRERRAGWSTAGTWMPTFRMPPRLIPPAAAAGAAVGAAGAGAAVGTAAAAAVGAAAAGAAVGAVVPG